MMHPSRRVNSPQAASPALHALMGLWALSSLIATFGSGTASAESRLAVVSVADSQELVTVLQPDASAPMQVVGRTRTPASPACMTYHAAGSRLYVAMSNPNAIAVYDHGDGANLTLIDQISLTSKPSYLRVDPTGRFLLSSHYSSGRVQVHRLEVDGKLQPSPVQDLAVAERAHCVSMDWKGRHALVPHTRPNLITQFRFDARSGRLFPASRPVLEREADSGPRHLVFHPHDPALVLGSDEQGCSVTSYRFDEKDGNLTKLQTVSSLPEGGVQGRVSTSDIHVHPNGETVYVANRGQGSIAVLRLNPESRQMTPIQFMKCPPTVRSFAITPDGQQLWAAGQRTGNLIRYHIGSDGKLDEQDSFEVGKGLWWLSFLPTGEDPPAFGQGLMAGEVTPHTALIQTRLTKSDRLNDSGDLPGHPGEVRFEYTNGSSFDNSTYTSWRAADQYNDYIVRAHLKGLQPATRYQYRAWYRPGEKTGDGKGPCVSSAKASFSTLPGQTSTEPVTFLVGSCMNYVKMMHGKVGRASGPVTASLIDKRDGFPAFASMKDRNPQFFVGTGDIVYYDNPFRVASTLPDLRRCWHEQFRFTRMRDFFRHVPTYWSKDDHDFRFNDSDNTGARLPTPRTGIDLFQEQLPICHDADCPMYRTHRVSKHLQIWLTEGRDYRSPNRMQDGPNKTLWGKAQYEWLTSTLLASDATWKILISPTPMVGPDDAHKQDNHANLNGFRTEATRFMKWLRANDIQGFRLICGDRHWQYHSIHPLGLQEFACGALNDENGRLGVEPGSPKGTDPQGMIRQPFLAPEPTGSFLSINAAEDIRFDFFTDDGSLRYTVTQSHSDGASD
ncbi:MAG: beta-propeller fold lactonase family protein [Planctomycetota bacterium]